MRMMCITAHPDDEAGGFGGTLRLYADKGVETCVICLTPGQAATNRGGAKDDRELAAMRRKEFAASCEILRVTRGIVLDYPDGKLYRQDLYRVVCDLTLHIREVRPQVILTFGPEGGLTGHTDHSMASVFAMLAFHWAGRANRYPDQLSGNITAHRPQKLYFTTADFSLPDRAPITMAPVTAILAIDDSFEFKIAAFKAHVSQSALWPRFEGTMRGKKKQEMFHLAASTLSHNSENETDLFAGTNESEPKPESGTIGV